VVTEQEALALADRLKTEFVNSDLRELTRLELAVSVLAKAYRKEKATHKITACYFPGLGELELTWQDIETDERAGITVKGVEPEAGKQVAKTVMPCVTQGATVDQAAIPIPKLDEALAAMEAQCGDCGGDDRHLPGDPCSGCELPVALGILHRVREAATSD